MFWIKEVEMVDSLEETKSSRSVAGKDFPKFEMLDVKIASALNETSKIPTSRRRSVSRTRKPKGRVASYEEDWSPSWSTTTFELLPRQIQDQIMLIYSLLFFTTIISRKLIKDGTKFYYPCQWYHLLMSWKVSTNWEYVSLRNSKPS